MNRKERQEERAERYREYAEAAEARSMAAYNASAGAVAGIEPGQPILVGHHSETAHHRALERCHNAMTRSVEESRKAEYYRRKAEAVENNNNIYLGDDDAVRRLEEKIVNLTATQERMKSANKILRSKKSKEEKVSMLMELGYSEKDVNAFLDNCFTFPSYMLTNNNAKISAAKKQLEKAKKLEETEDREYQIGDITVEECYVDNRLRIYFPGKPAPETISALKSNGYRWSPRNGCWQAYINSRGRRFIEELKIKETTI